MSDERVALVFPGQGSQRPGMAGPWRDHPAFARWEEASEVLGRDVARLGLDADEDELREPATCQVALFVHGAVVLEGWQAGSAAAPVAVAGHSLGEYDALLAAGVLSFADALRLVDARARHTGAAAALAPGTMVACLGYDVGDVRAACEQAGAHIANDNAPGQIVAAGSAEALDRLRELLGRVEAPRASVRAVNVGAAYHSPHMEPAVGPFTGALAEAAFADARVPVVANVDARGHTAAGEWPELLRAQLVTPVRWRESVATLAELGTTEVVELCAAPVLSGLVRRTDPDLARRNVKTPEDL